MKSADYLYDIGLELLKCARSWEGEARLLGNIKAIDLALMAVDYLRLRLESSGTKEPWQYPKAGATVPTEDGELFLAEVHCAEGVRRRLLKVTYPTPYNQKHETPMYWPEPRPDTWTPAHRNDIIRFKRVDWSEPNG